MRDAERLIDAYIDGELGAEGERELLEWLRSSRDNVRQFVRRTFDSRALRDLLSAEGLSDELRAESDRVAAESARALQVPRRERRRPGRPIAWLKRAVALTAAAILVVAGLIWRAESSRYPAPRATGSFRVAGGGQVRRGAVLIAGDGAATLELGGYCTVEMAPGSELKVAGRERAEGIELTGGTVTCKVDSGAGSFGVRTSAGTVAVTGTSFTVGLIEGIGGDMSAKRMFVHVLAGAVALSGAWGEMNLAKGEQTVVGPRQLGTVCNVKVVSDKIEDVSSIEAWKKSFIKPGMTDKEKGLAIWESCVKFRHQTNPPNEHMTSNVHDAIKNFNVYGYGMCCCVASHIEQFARSIGMKARGLGIERHSVPEVFWGGKWHYLDASLLCYFEEANGNIVSVKEFQSAVKQWLDAHPEMKNERKQREFMRNWGWKKGPALIASTKFLSQNGWLPAATHGWYSLMSHDGSRNFVFEYGYSQGYQLNIRLREGEKVIRNWFNKGLHVDMDTKANHSITKAQVGKGDMRYAPKYGDIAPGRVGNGEHIYVVPLSGGRYRAGAMEVENLKDSARGVTVAAAGQKGVLDLRMASSYVYLGGELTGVASIGAGGSIKVLMSRNHGVEWKEIASVTEAGPFKIDLKKLTYRLYDYRLKLELSGGGTGLSTLAVRHDIQHSQRALPALAAGSNTITFSAASANENTITIEGRCGLGSKGNALNITEHRPVFEAAAQTQYGIGMTAGKGSVTFPVETPGDMVRLRFGTHYRARGATDGWDYLVSFDDGKSWKKAGRAAGPTPGNCEYVTFGDVPKGIRKALVRFDGQQRNTTYIFDMCICADYVEPDAGFWPVRITYVWEENGQPKQHVRTATKPEETYRINCGAAPLMKSIILELDPKAKAAAAPASPRASARPEAQRTPRRAPQPRSDEQKARGLLNIADNFIRANMRDEARAKLLEVIRKYPNTEGAGLALEKLRKLGAN